MRAMRTLEHELTSEMIPDLRDEQARKRAKHNDLIDTLNPKVQSSKSPPELIHRQVDWDAEVYYLEKVNIILRTESNPKNEKLMRL